MTWLRRYWELKLVALVVAVALWVYTSGQVRVERQIVVEMRSENIAGLPAHLQPVGITPSGFTVVLSVPARRLDELAQVPLRPRLTVRRDEQRPGRVSFPVSAFTLGLGADVRIVRTEPADLRSLEVVLARIVEEPLPVALPEVDGLPAGIAATVTPSLSRVRVRGPEDELSRAVAAAVPVRFAPIRLADIDPALVGERIETVTLEPMPSQLVPIEPVQARIQLRPARQLSEQVRCDVQVLLPPAHLGRWLIEPADPQVALHVRGPENLVRALTPEDITAWVDLRSLRAGEIPPDFPVHVTGPSGITVDAVRVPLVVRAATP
jgi:YbbR domain-containing protein